MSSDDPTAIDPRPTVDEVMPPKPGTASDNGISPCADLPVGSDDADVEAAEDERAAKEHAKQMRALSRRDRENEVNNRATYTKAIFVAVVVWMALVFVLLVLSGSGLRGFSLPEAVLITMLGTTTGNVIGVFIFVAKYLFPNRNGDSSA